MAVAAVRRRPGGQHSRQRRHQVRLECRQAGGERRRSFEGQTGSVGVQALGELLGLAAQLREPVGLAGPSMDVDGVGVDVEYHVGYRGDEDRGQVGVVDRQDEAVLVQQGADAGGRRGRAPVGRQPCPGAVVCHRGTGARNAEGLSPLRRPGTVERLEQSRSIGAQTRQTEYARLGMHSDVVRVAADAQDLPQRVDLGGLRLRHDGQRTLVERPLTPAEVAGTVEDAIRSHSRRLSHMIPMRTLPSHANNAHWARQAGATVGGRLEP